jgi:hypothetical protein
MGDFRFHFKAEFSMGGFEDAYDCSLNLEEDDDIEFVDKRVANWIKKCFLEGYLNVKEGIWDAEERRQVAQERERDKLERDQYERLKAKFENLDKK